MENIKQEYEDSQKMKVKMQWAIKKEKDILLAKTKKIEDAHKRI